MSVSGFISRAACRGHRPTNLVSQVGNSRPMLVGQLLKNRDVARFIVAPSGYGKTYLASEYAETICSWVHSFWVNARSPCFIRDLDAASIATSCLSFDPEASLVVFDDLPMLDAERREAFSCEMDKLLEAGCEVMVTCVPSCDMTGGFQRDRLRLGAESLLLDDGELDSIRTADERIYKPASRLGPALRVPALAWGVGPEKAAQFAKGVLSEDIPSDLLCVMGSALVLQKGSVADLISFGPVDIVALKEVAQDYPHLGFDEGFESFESPSVDIDDLVAPLKRLYANLGSCSRFGSSEEIAREWASLLVRDERPARACALMRLACPRQARVEWASENAYEIIQRACFYPLLQSISDREGCASGIRMHLDALEALCRQVLGDRDGALRCAKRHAFNDEAPEGVRILSRLVVARAGSEQVSLRVREGLAADAASAVTDARRCSAWALLARAWCASTQGLAEMCRLWQELQDASVPDGVLSVAASWLFNLLDGSEEELTSEIILVRRRAERFVREQLAANAASGKVDYLAASAGLSMEGARARGAVHGEGPLEAGSLILLRRVEMDVLSQRRLFEEGGEQGGGEWAIARPSVPAAEPGAPAKVRAERSVPILTLRMFGRFEVAVGGVPVDYALFKRQNTRALLVLLAVNQGRELSRDVVAESMWPRSTEKVAQKNFYTVWAHLRRALALPDGTCPYLVRHQYGCCLDARYVQSDAARLNDICRELLFSTPNIGRWSSLFSEVDKDFSSDLMPSENKNTLIIQARNDYRTRLVDALVAATLNIIDSEDPQWGVWFARAALGRDETREDAYVALMRAQIAVKQRTAAMMTYLRCRRVLSEQLGIDPSPETTELYESLLDAS